MVGEIGALEYCDGLLVLQAVVDLEVVGLHPFHYCSLVLLELLGLGWLGWLLLNMTLPLQDKIC